MFNNDKIEKLEEQVRELQRLLGYKVHNCSKDHEGDDMWARFACGGGNDLTFVDDTEDRIEGLEKYLGIQWERAKTAPAGYVEVKEKTFVNILEKMKPSRKLTVNGYKGHAGRPAYSVEEKRKAEKRKKARLYMRKWTARKRAEAVAKANQTQ